MTTIADRILTTGGRSTGFDYMRLSLAFGIVLWHTFPLSYGAQFSDNFQASLWRPAIAFLVPMFFALSGFLVAGSLERSPTMITFLGLRVIRILPALFVEVTLSALILGPLLTVIPLSDYFSSAVFAHYFLNIVGNIHYALPGLFLHNPVPNVVNGQLWTVPWELKCYITLTVLALIGIAKTKRPLLIITIATCIASWAYSLFHPADLTQGVPGVALIPCFLGGVIFYNMKSTIPWSGKIALACAVISIVLLLVGGDYFVGFPLAYLTVYLGLLNPRKLSVLKGADYSYGVYLYGYAIQQAIANMGAFTHHWYVNLALAIPLVSIFAGLSWTFVEKPALRLRHFLPSTERAATSLTARFLRAGQTGGVL